MKILNTISWLAGSMLACAVLAAPANAQTLSAANVKVSGTVAATAKAEAVAFSGTISASASYIADPAGGAATMVYFIDGTSLAGKGATSGKEYTTTCQANLTRPFPATLKDSIVLTCAYFADGVAPQTAQLTFNVTLSSAHTVTVASAAIARPTGL
jgi:hypothetical protein